MGSTEEKEKPLNSSQYDTSSLRPKQEQKSSKTLHKWQEQKTPKVPLKIHSGSILPHKSLENRCRSQVAIKPPRSTGTKVYKGKNHTCNIQGHKV